MAGGRGSEEAFEVQCRFVGYGICAGGLHVRRFRCVVMKFRSVGTGEECRTRGI